MLQEGQGAIAPVVFREKAAYRSEIVYQGRM